MTDETEVVPENAGETEGNGDKRRPKGSVPPAVQFAEAVEISKEFYKRGGQGNRELLAELIGNKATSSIFGKKALALRRYGLIRSEGDEYWISEIGQNIGAPKNEKIYAEAIGHAFLSIPTYRMLYNEYKDRPLPHEMYMINTIRGNVPEGGEQEWVSSFKQGAKAAGLLKEHPDGSAVLLSTGAIKSEGKPSEEKPTREESAGRAPAMNGLDGQAKTPIPLGLNRLAYVEFPSDMTPKEIKTFLRVVTMILEEEQEAESK